MANFVYTGAKTKLANADLDLASADLRALLVMTNTTADTEKDVANIAAFSTLDEHDGANYARKTLADEAVAQDDANDRAELDATDVTWTALGAGTRQCQALVVYVHVTNDSDSYPFLYIDTGGFPFTATGADVTIQWNAEGIFQLT